MLSALQLSQNNDTEIEGFVSKGKSLSIYYFIFLPEG